MDEVPTLAEIKETLFRMPKEKASGPDGLIVEILQHHWSVISEDYLAAFLHFFRNRHAKPS